MAVLEEPAVIPHIMEVGAAAVSEAQAGHPLLKTITEANVMYPGMSVVAEAP